MNYSFPWSLGDWLETEQQRVQYPNLGSSSENTGSYTFHDGTQRQLFVRLTWNTVVFVYYIGFLSYYINVSHLSGSETATLIPRCLNSFRPRIKLSGGKSQSKFYGQGHVLSVTAVWGAHRWYALTPHLSTSSHCHSWICQVTYYMTKKRFTTRTIYP